MENQFIPVKKIKITIYIFFLICLFGLSVYWLIIDNTSNPFWNILTYLCIVLVVFYTYIYGKDLFSKKAGLYIMPEGLKLNLEYYKDILVNWQDITDIQLKSYIFVIKVKDSEKYLNQISKISGLFIRGNIKRFGTIFVIRWGQLNMKKDILLEELNQALKKYKRKK